MFRFFKPWYSAIAGACAALLISAVVFAAQPVAAQPVAVQAGSTMYEASSFSSGQRSLSSTNAYTVFLPFIERAGPPTILSFTANPASIAPGDSTTLAWNVAGADSLSVSPGIGTVTGSNISVQPVTTTQYVLLATNANGTTTAQATVTVVPAGSGPSTFLAPYSLPDNSIMTNKVPQVATDAAGGVHAIYTANWSDNTGRRPAYYAYCSSNCNSTGSFSTIELGSNVLFAQLALDPAGHPRVLLTTADNPQEPTQWQYTYGECNDPAPCTAWTLTPILPAPAFSYTFFPNSENNQSFALDPQGRPRFVYDYKESYFATADTRYRYCDASCTDAANWSETSFNSNGEWQNVALAFTPTGLPRLAFFLAVDSGTPFPNWQIDYLECGTPDCATWSGAGLATNASSGGGGSSAIALRITSNGEPRLGYFTGAGTGGTLTPDSLNYLWCRSGCSTTASNWTAVELGKNVGEWGFDLALDQQDRPRLAYHDSNAFEMGYAWCNTNCESNSDQNWQAELIPSRAATDQEIGHIRYSCPTCIPPIPDCQSAWNDGYWPSLALDSAGNPRIAFEVHLLSYGGCSVETLARFTRVAVFNQP